MPDERLMFFYYGLSMEGTFHFGDCLFVEPVPLHDLRPGDVVIYRRPESPDADQDKIVHRVIKVVPGGLITQGDNNSAADRCVVLEENLIGRISHVEREGRRRRVRGGWAGVWRSRFLHFWHPTWKHLKAWINRRIFPLGRWFYHWLRRSGVVARLWHPRIIQVHVETRYGSLIKYAIGNRTVAYWWPESGSFKCRKPYDLIIQRPKQ